MNCSRSLRTGLPLGSTFLKALDAELSDEEIETICRQLDYQWRVRVFTPAVTVRSMVHRGLHPDQSIHSVLTELAAANPGLKKTPSDSAWCQARSRLPEALWAKLIARSVERLEPMAGEQGRCWNRPLYLFDGSTVSMPDTSKLVEAFGYADTKHGASRFPVMRLSLLVRAGANAVCDYQIGPYRESETAQLHTLWGRVPEGAILLCDKLLSSFYNLAKCRERGVDVVAPLHQRRDPAKLIAHGQRLGKNDWRVELDLAPSLRRKYNDPALPTTLPVRLLRTVRHRQGKPSERWLVTTLLDPCRASRRSVVQLYRRRWEIETRIGSLKTTLQMNVLRSTTPHGVHSEVAATLLAHNLIHTVMHQAARKTNTPPDRISFLGAVRTLVAFSASLRAAPEAARSALYDRMLEHIASRVNLKRPGRTEPRLVKRDPRRYGFLKIPRKDARQLCLS
jgi:hypothetical protein